jgi:hypothetical protein
MTTAAADVRPLAVRVLRVTGWVGTIVGAAVAIPSLAIGGSDGFDELAVVWAVPAAIGVLLVLAGISALLAGARSFAGLVSGLVSCAILLLLVPVGTAVTIAIAVIASQTWPQLREYYGLSRRSA